MGLFDAIEYVPTNPTYAIRINAKSYGGPEVELKKSGLYTIVNYSFDDIEPFFAREGQELFDEDIARRMLAEFREKGEDKETLMVHCSRGKNRSPAVGIALNEIFNLGYNTKELKDKYPESNWYIYRTLIKAAKKQ